MPGPGVIERNQAQPFWPMPTCLGGGRKSYRCVENVTFTAESARRCGQASGRGRKRICQVFRYPKLSGNCALCHCTQAEDTLMRAAFFFSSKSETVKGAGQRSKINRDVS